MGGMGGNAINNAMRTIDELVDANLQLRDTNDDLRKKLEAAYKRGCRDTLEKAVEAVCWRCKAGKPLMDWCGCGWEHATTMGESTPCPASPIHDLIAELDAETS